MKDKIIMALFAIALIASLEVIDPSSSSVSELNEPANVAVTYSGFQAS